MNPTSETTASYIARFRFPSAGRSLSQKNQASHVRIVPEERKRVIVPSVWDAVLGRLGGRELKNKILIDRFQSAHVSLSLTYVRWRDKRKLLNTYSNKRPQNSKIKKQKTNTN